MNVRYELDPELRLRDKGVMAIMLALESGDVDPTIKNIYESTYEGATSIRTSLKTLTDLGYFKRDHVLIDNSYSSGFHYVYEINATREAPETESGQ